MRATGLNGQAVRIIKPKKMIKKERGFKVLQKVPSLQYKNLSGGLLLTATYAAEMG